MEVKHLRRYGELYEKPFAIITGVSVDDSPPILILACVYTIDLMVKAHLHTISLLLLFKLS